MDLLLNWLLHTVWKFHLWYHGSKPICNSCWWLELGTFRIQDSRSSYNSDLSKLFLMKPDSMVRDVRIWCHQPPTCFKIIIDSCSIKDKAIEHILTVDINIGKLKWSKDVRIWTWKGHNCYDFAGHLLDSHRWIFCLWQVRTIFWWQHKRHLPLVFISWLQVTTYEQ